MCTSNFSKIHDFQIEHVVGHEYVYSQHENSIFMVLGSLPDVESCCVGQIVGRSLGIISQKGALS